MSKQVEIRNSKMNMARQAKVAGKPYQHFVDGARRANLELIRSRQCDKAGSCRRSMEEVALGIGFRKYGEG